MNQQYKSYMIALDVGGSYIKSSTLNERNEIIPESVQEYDAKANETKDVILNHFINIIKKQLLKISQSHFRLLGIGLAFPGPFDYKQGISYIKGIDKFDHLYDVNIREELLKRMNRDEFIASKMADDFLIVFDNDANLFALGESQIGEMKALKKVICLTIGTGAGSAFLEKGILVKEREGIPRDGWIYNMPFKSSIVDDYISKRGVMAIATEKGIDTENTNVKSIAIEASRNNIPAMDTFYQFGIHIGEALQPYVQSFQPQGIVLGGQISKSIDLFIDGIYSVIDRSKVKVVCTKDTSQSTFIGIGYLIKKSMKDNLTKGEVKIVRD